MKIFEEGEKVFATVAFSLEEIEAMGQLREFENVDPVIVDMAERILKNLAEEAERDMKNLVSFLKANPECFGFEKRVLEGKDG